MYHRGRRLRADHRGGDGFYDNTKGGGRQVAGPGIQTNPLPAPYGTWSAPQGAAFFYDNNFAPGCVPTSPVGSPNCGIEVLTYYTASCP